MKFSFSLGLVLGAAFALGAALPAGRPCVRDSTFQHCPIFRVGELTLVMQVSACPDEVTQAETVAEVEAFAN